MQCRTPGKSKKRHIFPLRLITENDRSAVVLVAVGGGNYWKMPDTSIHLIIAAHLYCLTHKTESPESNNKRLDKGIGSRKRLFGFETNPVHILPISTFSLERTTLYIFFNCQNCLTCT